MGKFKRYWMESVVPAVRNYKFYKEDDSEQARIITSAVDRALSEYTDYDDDPLKRRAIYMIYIDGTHTKRGTAILLNCSPRTIARWTDEFMRRVGAYAGYVGTSCTIE